MLMVEEQIAVGPFCLDLRASRLLRDGVEIPLRAQAFHALRALIRSSGRPLSHEQMIREAWHGVSVSRHTVAVTVGEVKRALEEYGGWIGYRPNLGYCLAVPKCESLVRKGWHLWYRHTREGLEKALASFQRAALEDGADFRAFEGISASYLMLGTLGILPPRDTYDAFLAAHGRAVELSGLTPERRADRAYALYVFERRFEEAERELLRALRDRPNWVHAHLRLGMLYLAEGRFDQALREVAQAIAADALMPLLPCTEILIRLGQRDFAGAIACGEAALDLHPHLPVGRTLYAQALDYSGRAEDALAQYRLACAAAPDMPWLRALEAMCLARSGQRQKASRIFDELDQLRASEYVDPYPMAALLGVLGRRKEAFRELERSVEENSSTLFLLDVDPKMDQFRGDPRFTDLRERVFGCVRQQATAAAGD